MTVLFVNNYLTLPYSDNSKRIFTATMKLLADKIRLLRTERGLLQRQLAALVGDKAPEELEDEGEMMGFWSYASNADLNMVSEQYQSAVRFDSDRYTDKVNTIRK